jgi:glycosyltransferase involved in cell wall biosynthesis
MKRVAFYFEDRWVFAKIFNELRKHLYPDYDCDIVDWGNYLHAPAGQYLKDKYDIFVSIPFGCFFLHEQYGIELERCYAHLHSEYDVVDILGKYKNARDYFSRLGGFGAVSEPIKNCAVAHNLRAPELLPVGVTVANYHREPPTQIRRLGYFGQTHRVDAAVSPHDIKRGYLAQRVAEAAGLDLVAHDNIPYPLIDAAYKYIDAVIFCSLSEGNPYPALEGAAAGLPVFGTAVGVFSEFVEQGAGVVLPTKEDDFVAAAVECIHQLNDAPDLLRAVCQQAAKVGSLRDWSFVAPRWKHALDAMARTVSF